MFLSNKNNFKEFSYQRKQFGMKNETLLHNPLNFESFFSNPNAKTILEEVNKKSGYLRKRINLESTIVSETEYSKIDNSYQPYNQKINKKNMFHEKDDSEETTNNLESYSKFNVLPKILHNSIYNNEKTEHNAEVTRDYHGNNQEEIENKNKEYINIYSNIEKVNSISEFKVNDHECYNDILDEDEVSPKKLNIFKKMDVKTCVWIFLSYAFLDTFIAVYYACSPLQIAFIVMSMGSLLFYKYT